MKSETRNTIMNMIRTGSVSVNMLANALDVPHASVRRLIGELRREGWKIVTGYFGYRLQTPERA